jgi:hypothetical protein
MDGSVPGAPVGPTTGLFAWQFPVASTGVKVGATTVTASRHRLIGVCSDRHDRHSGGECKGQGEDYGQLFHDRAPLFIWGSARIYWEPP